MSELELLIGGRLEATAFTADPENSAHPDRAKTCLICTHPHSWIGGNLANNVVEALYFEAQKIGYSALRFNFRGVGRSKGISSIRGGSERSDVVSVVEWAMANMAGIERCVILGYSYGSLVGWSVMDKCPAVQAVAAISPPMGWGTRWLFGHHFEKAKQSSKFKLLIIGDRDDFTTQKAFQKLVDSVAEPKRVVTFHGVDHFWWGTELSLCETIFDWLKTLEAQKWENEDTSSSGSESDSEESDTSVSAQTPPVPAVASQSAKDDCVIS